MEIGCHPQRLGQLAEQIRQGAPFDVFLSADGKFVRRLADEGIIRGETVRPYALGSLVLATDAKSELKPKGLADLTGPGIKFIAIANPETAPYGKAATQAIERAGLAEALKPRLVTAGSVRQALQMVQSGNAEVGIVSRSIADVPGIRSVQLPLDASDPIIQYSQGRDPFESAGGRGSLRQVPPGRGRARDDARPRIRRAAQLQERLSEGPGIMGMVGDLAPFWLSIRVASIATVLIVMIGVPVAWLLARGRFPGKGLVAGILVLLFEQVSPGRRPEDSRGDVQVLGRRGWLYTGSRPPTPGSRRSPTAAVRRAPRDGRVLQDVLRLSPRRHGCPRGTTVTARRARGQAPGFLPGCSSLVPPAGDGPAVVLGGVRPASSWKFVAVEIGDVGHP